MELVTPSGNVSFDLHEMTTLTGDATDVAPGSGHIVKIPVPTSLDSATIDHLALLVSYLPQEA
jgi:putative protease